MSLAHGDVAEDLQLGISSALFLEADVIISI